LAIHAVVVTSRACGKRRKPPGGARKPERPASAPTGIAWFLVLFVVYMVVGNLVLSFSAVEKTIVEPWTDFNARGAAAIARMFGVEARTDGTYVTYPNGTMNVLNGCNGIEALLILVAATLAFPASWGRRAAGVLAGAVAIFGANIVRLVNLILVAHFKPDWLRVFHVYIWQALIVLIAFAIFLTWGTLFAQVRTVKGPSGSA